jgi:hypothetical protein
VKKISIALLLLLFISTCKKNQVAQPALSGPKLLLVNEKDLDAPGSDTILVTKYTYDQNNRIIEQTIAEPGGQYTDTTKYTYDSNGNIAAMYLHSAPSPIYTYSNVNGKPVTSFLGVQTTDPWSSFTLKNNQITSVTYSEFNYVISYTGNNFNIMTETNVNNDVVKRTFTYGSKKSPFYVGGFKYFMGDYPPYSQIQGQNEVLQRVDENSGAATGTFTFSYEYNSDNYPVKATDYKNGVVTGYQVFTYAPAN